MQEGLSIQETIARIVSGAGDDIAAAGSTQALEALRVSLLGKKGSLSQLMRGMGALTPEERPAMGQLINSAKGEVEAMLTARSGVLRKAERAQALALEAIDVTEPRPGPRLGSLHPVSLVLRDLADIFTGMGYEVVEGPEVELDYYNFELMNLPKNHPARDAQDTFYIEDSIVLRTHTSPVQARTMLSRKPPIRIVCPGVVFRADEADATHSPNFHQMEGLVVDRHITMADLKGTLDTFARRLYGEDIGTRFRPSFFPFTEPSAEVDLTCVNCRGQGCRICKGTGWIEVLGCGMVNPRVLSLCGIDPEIYTGFAFGMGLERLAMLRYDIPDMRLLYEGDTRFLTQFR